MAKPAAAVVAKKKKPASPPVAAAKKPDAHGPGAKKNKNAFKKGPPVKTAVAKKAAAPAPAGPKKEATKTGAKSVVGGAVSGGVGKEAFEGKTKKIGTAESAATDKVVREKNHAAKPHAENGKKPLTPEALVDQAIARSKKAKEEVEARHAAKGLENGKAESGKSEAEDTADEAEVVLTDAEGRRYCRVKECDQISLVDAYCRYHYLLFWKKIQVRKKILTEGKLERYIEELTARYPDKYLEMLRKDLRCEKDFMAAITELEIDESGVDSEYEDEAQSYLEEVRGMSGEGGGSAREDEDY